jgi:formylmethanofuran dehydrogenase subunit E
MAAVCAQCGEEIGYADRGRLDYRGEPICLRCDRELLQEETADESRPKAEGGEERSENSS